MSTQISFFADPPQDPSELTRLASANDVLEIALRDILREELGETYTVSVDLQQELFQRGGGHVAVQFTAAPAEPPEDDRPRTAGNSADAEGRAVRGPDQPRQGDARRREHETGMKQNGYWLSRLQSAKLLGLDPVAHFLEREKRIASVTPANLRRRS